MTKTELAAAGRVRAWWRERGEQLHKDGESLRPLTKIFVRDTNERALTEDMIIQILAGEAGGSQPSEYV